MNFWLRLLHIAAMSVWLTGLFFLPRVLIAQARARVSGAAATDDPDLGELGGKLFFGLMTPAAAITIALGMALLPYGFTGPWLPAKLILVALLVLLHVYFGKLLVDSSAGRARHPVVFYRFLNWIPLFLMLAIVALTAAKPLSLPPVGVI
jgi:protoporphyrinogen IX oxidase